MSEPAVIQSTLVNDHFPFEQIRPQQERALSAFMNAEAKQKRHRLFELPTGAGKSPLAYAMMSWAQTQRDGVYQPGGYVLTTQKTLQAQYMRDFANMGMIELKGAANYTCDSHETDCSAGSLMNKALKAQGQESECSGECPYKLAKANFINRPVGVTNFAYFLSETKFVRALKPRQVLIIDEAHNTEQQIIGFAEIEITESRMTDWDLPRQLPVFNPGDNEKCKDWLAQVVLPAATKAKERIEAEAITLNEAGDKGPAMRANAKANAIEKYCTRIEQFVESPTLGDWLVHTNERANSVVIKPLTAALFAEELLFKMGKRVVFMSATILDKRAFARSLGLDMNQCGFLRIDSDFPLENRLIHFFPAGSMSMKHQEQTMPKILRRIERILDKHATEKGIIHCNSYKLQQAIFDYFENSPHRYRLLAHSNQPGDRDVSIVKHVNSPEPTVLLSPSMTEGLDLKDELSRFTVIAKVPFPYLGDPYVRARMERDKDWYIWQTGLQLVQATGRSIRSAEDRATTYVLDQDFSRFMAQAQSILPQWWIDSVVYH